MNSHKSNMFVADKICPLSDPEKLVQQLQQRILNKRMHQNNH
jgi:hypothetical protein